MLCSGFIFLLHINPDYYRCNVPKKKCHTTLISLSDLRALAEKRHQVLQLKRPDSSSSPEDILRIIHELEVHQIELELQQEELIRSREELSNSKAEQEDSLKRVTELYDFAPLGYLTLTRNSKIVEANLTATRILGINRSELRGNYLTNLFIPADRQVIHGLLEKVFTKKQHGYGEATLIPHETPLSGTQQSVAAQTFRLDALHSDSPHECRVIITDITDQKLSENALKQSQYKFRMLFEGHSSIMLVIDETGNIIDANPAAAAFYGWPIEVLKQMNINQINVLSPEEIRHELNKWKRESLSQKHLFFFHRRADGSVLNVEIFAQKIEVRNKELIYDIIYDITERKHAEQAMQSSERKFHSITEQMAEMVFVTDSNGSLTYVSPAAEHLFGYLPQEMTGHSVTEYLVEEDISTAQSLFQETFLQQFHTRIVELKFYRKSTTLFDGELHFQYYQDNKSSGMIGIIHDITERNHKESLRKQYEEKLQESEQFLATIYEEVNHSIFVVDVCPEGGFRFKGINPNHEKLTCFKNEEIIGKTPDEFFDHDVALAIIHNYERCIQEGKTIQYEESFPFLGQQTYWETTLNPVRNESGHIYRIIGTSKNITEQKKMLDQLIASKEKAEESDRVKSAFLANISHEIRTPMNGILGFSELLKNSDLSGEEMNQYIDLIQKSGKRMLDLINDLIDISRIDAEETKVQITETPLNELMHQIHAFFKPEAAAKGLRLTCTTALSDNESIMNTDSGKLHQILTNLVKNALKFTHHGGIDFGYTRKMGILEFYCIDSGMGIPFAMQTKIFDRFQQVDNTLTRGYEGAGLGLSITKAFIEMLGGTIRVESVEGEGSTFLFTLPYNPVLSPSHCVLIAEDDELSTLFLKNSLKGGNFTILCAANGHEAVEIVHHHSEINLVLMDIKMPLLNGVEATRQIKQLRPNLPVIAQTAFTSAEERVKARNAGCDRFIAKPIKKSELLEMIKELLPLA